MSNPSSRWSDLRDFCSAVREVVLVLAMLSLLVVPSVVRKTLERAGIRSVAGVEFDVENIAQSQDDLNAALVQIEELRNQLATAHQQVQGLAESSPAMALQSTDSPGTFDFKARGAAPSLSPTPSPAPSLSSISRMLATMKDQAEETDKSLRRSKGHTQKFLEHAGRQVKLTPPSELFGSESGLESSADSASQADESESLRR
ncbi:MAG: hypothetical protein ACO1RT_07855 [Planctomycetaceae bacterium]